MTALRLIKGGRAPRPMLFVSASEHSELHLELLAARSERTVFASKVHALVRTAARHLASRHPAAAGTSLVEIERLTVQEANRVLAMATAECACGIEGAGHGPADDDVLPLPVELVA